MGLILTTEAMRVVQRNERGVVTSRKRFTRGQEVPSDVLTDERREQLLQSGALVESEDDVPDLNSDEAARNRGLATTIHGPSQGSTAVQGARSPEDMDPQGDPEDFDAQKANDESTDDDESEDGDDNGGETVTDKYSDMEYADLRREAQARTGDASGNADALRARLRAQDTFDADK